MRVSPSADYRCSHLKGSLSSCSSFANIAIKSPGAQDVQWHIPEPQPQEPSRPSSAQTDLCVSVCLCVLSHSVFLQKKTSVPPVFLLAVGNIYNEGQLSQNTRFLLIQKSSLLRRQFTACSVQGKLSLVSVFCFIRLEKRSCTFNSTRPEWAFLHSV